MELSAAVSQKIMSNDRFEDEVPDPLQPLWPTEDKWQLSEQQPIALNDESVRYGGTTKDFTVLVRACFLSGAASSNPPLSLDLAFSVRRPGTPPAALRSESQEYTGANARPAVSRIHRHAAPTTRSRTPSTAHPPPMPPEHRTVLPARDRPPHRASPPP